MVSLNASPCVTLLQSLGCLAVQAVLLPVSLRMWSGSGHVCLEKVGYSDSVNPIGEPCGDLQLDVATVKGW